MLSEVCRLRLSTLYLLSLCDLCVSNLSLHPQLSHLYRKGTEEVPGCVGDALANPSTDYCARRPSADTVWMKGNDGLPADNFPLGLCEGDCDGDIDCQPGLVW